LVVVGVLPSGPLVFFLHRVFPAAVAVARVPEVLEDEEAIAVAGFVEFGSLGEGAAPDADEVEVHVAVQTDLGVIALGGEAEELVGDDPVAAFYEDLLAVDGGLAAFGGGVPRCGYLADAKGYCGGCDITGDDLILGGNRCVDFCKFEVEGIKILRTVTIRPPETGVLERFDRKLYFADLVGLKGDRRGPFGVLG
jgi:hypothetical protein